MTHPIPKEPVATAWRWRYRNPPDRLWSISADQPPNDEPGIEVEPLYSEAVLIALREEVAELRRIISECATATGAGVAPSCSLDFMAQLPGEIKAQREAAEAEVARMREQAIAIAEGYAEGYAEGERVLQHQARREKHRSDTLLHAYAAQVAEAIVTDLTALRSQDTK